MAQENRRAATEVTKRQLDSQKTVQEIKVTVESRRQSRKFFYNLTSSLTQREANLLFSRAFHTLHILLRLIFGRD